MRRIFNKVLAGITSVALIATLLVGVNVTNNVQADDTVTLNPWSFYEGGEVSRSVDRDGWPERFYNSVSTTAGESKGSDFWYVGPHKQYVDGPEVTWDTTKVADGFTADIKTTGWDGDYTGENGALIGDNPYLLRAYMNNIQATAGHDYTISFTVGWSNEKNAPEKNIAVGVTNAYGESVFKDDPSAITKIKVASGSKTTYTQDFTLWAGDTISVSLAYGAFLVSFESGETTENVAAVGVLTVSDFKIVDKGLNPDYTPEPPKQDETTAPSGNNGGTSNNGVSNGGTVTTPGNNTPAPTPTVKKLGKVKKLKVKNNKKGTIKITWKKVTNAKSYQIKVGKKTYTSKKTKKTVKKLKKGKKYTVKVRAKATGYKTGSWAKKKIKIKK